MELRVARQEALQDQRRLLERGLEHFDLLETTRERSVALDVRAVLLERGRTDAAELAARERGLEQVRGVERAAARGAGADHGVDLVHEQDRAR